MAERNVNIKVAIKPDSSDPAAPLKAVANASRTAKQEIDKQRDSMQKAGREGRSAGDLLSNMLTAQAKKTADATKRVNELTEALKKTSATTQQISGFARTLGREMQLTTKQINEALVAAGQLKIGAGGELRGMVDSIHRRETRKMVRTGLEFMGPMAGIAALHYGVSEGLKLTPRQHGYEQALLNGESESEKTGYEFATGAPIVGPLIRAAYVRANAESAERDRGLNSQLSTVQQDAAKRRERRNEQIAETDRQLEADARMRQSIRDNDSRVVELQARRAATGRTGQILQNPMARGLLTDERFGGMRMESRLLDEDIEAQRKVARDARGVAGGYAREAGMADVNVKAAQAREDTQTANKWATARNEALKAQAHELERAKTAESRIADSAMEQAQITAQMSQTRMLELKAARSRVENFTTRFGAMTQEDQKKVVDAANQYKTGGLGSLTPEELNLLQANGLGGDELRRGLLQRGEQSGAGKLLGLFGEQSRDDLQKQIEGLKVNAAVNLNFDANQVRAALEEVFKKFAKDAAVVAAELDQSNEVKRQALKAATAGGFLR
jgi:hypothetical protein